MQFFYFSGSHIQILADVHPEESRASYQKDILTSGEEQYFQQKESV